MCVLAPVPPALISLQTSPGRITLDSGNGVYVLIGQLATFTCSIGSPSTPVNFTWFHSNTLLALPLDQRSLTVNASSMSAAGAYRCVVSNNQVQPSGVNFTLPMSVQLEYNLFIQGRLACYLKVD